VWHYAEEAAEECDLMMVIGTSSLVFPAANLPLLAIGRGTPAIQINPTDTQLNQVATFNLKGKAGVILPRLYELAFITELGMKC
jgi:NAD-dependent deacetylase